MIINDFQIFAFYLRGSFCWYYKSFKFILQLLLVQYVFKNMINEGASEKDSTKDEDKCKKKKKSQASCSLLDNLPFLCYFCSISVMFCKVINILVTYNKHISTETSEYMHILHIYYISVIMKFLSLKLTYMHKYWIS